MAGDKFHITVYAAHETADGKTLRLEVNSAAPLPIDPKLTADSGDFEIWRRISLVRYMKKTAGVKNLIFADIAAFYQPAFLDLVDDSGGPMIYPAADWNANIADAISNWSSKEQLIVDSAVDQYASGNDGVFIRTRAQFHDALVQDGMSPADATDWMNNNKMSNPGTYGTTAQDLVIPAMVNAFDKKFRSDIPGVNISQISEVHNVIGAAIAAGSTSWTTGQAADYPSGDRNHCAFLSLMDATQISALHIGAVAEKDAAHEFGHHFFLPHPEMTHANGVHESGYNAHDTTVHNCLMSYSNGVRVLCGLCQLRLRGWDKDALQTTPTANHKP